MNSKLNVLLPSGRPLLVVLALVFLPWLAVVFFAAGARAALNFAAYAIVVFAAGYSIVTAALPPCVRIQTVALAPAAGILAVSALTAFWVRLGLPVVWAPALWVALMAVGALDLFRDRASLAKSTVAYGLTLALFSALICAVYFLPSAFNDLVQRRDGSFNWKFIDSQHSHAMAASIKTGGSPPKTPGTVTAELLYHFGPYAPAAAISRLDGLDLGDALARVTRGASLWALVLSCFGLGTFLSLKATGQKFGGILSVAGLFFYGSLLSLFTEEATHWGHVAGAILFNIPGVTVRADGGPFAQLGGGSMLYSLVAITAVMGLCLVERERGSALTWRGVFLLALPALAVPMHSAASLYCLGVAGILLFWGRLRETASWLPMTLMVCVYLGAWTLMDYRHATDAVGLTIKEHIFSQWWTLAVFFIVGLGFRIAGFRWISRPWKDPLSALVLASVLGLPAFYFLTHFRTDAEFYGIYFFQSIFSIFAFSRVTSGCWRGVERSQMIADWLKLAIKGMVLIGACGVLIGIVAYATHSHTGIDHFGPKILAFFLMLSFLVGALALMKRSLRSSTATSGFLVGALLVGFLAWIPNFIRFGIGTVKTDTTYTHNEVRGLRRLGELMAPNERFATNRHALDPPIRNSSAPPLDTEADKVSSASYGYSALSERAVLLEGYVQRNETALPWFKTLFHDNELLFSATDPETVREIARAWRVRFLVARPGTDISLPRPLPAWLVEQQDCGALKIYRID